MHDTSESLVNDKVYIYIMWSSIGFKLRDLLRVYMATREFIVIFYLNLIQICGIFFLIITHQWFGYKLSNQGSMIDETKEKLTMYRDLRAMMVCKIAIRGNP